MKAATFQEPAACTVLRISQYPKETSTVPAKTKESVTWQHLYSVIAGFAGVLLAASAFFYTSLLPDKVQSIISTSGYLKERFDANQAGLDKINERLDKIGPENLHSLLLPLKNPALIFESLREIVSGDQASLATALPEARKLLPILQDSKGKIPEHGYQRVSQPLIKKYPRAPENIKSEIWLTFVALATTKSATDTRTYPPTELELERAKKAGNLLEGGIFDLSKNEEWRDTIFKNCQITVSNPKQTLGLTRVRFMDVDFQSTPQNQAGENLVAALLNNDSPAITRTIVEFNVKINVVVPCCLEPMEPTDTLANSKQASSLVRKHHLRSGKARSLHHQVIRPRK